MPRCGNSTSSPCCSGEKKCNVYLSREIPVTFGRLKELQLLHLRQNELVGEIPVTLGYCHQLTILDIADNQLSGGIPTSFGFLRALEQLMLYNNSLEGNLPASLINLANLTRINLSKNKMNGSIAPLCGSRSFLSFDVTNNAFDGEIPEELGNSPTLDRLRLGKNRFTGRIPVSLGMICELSLLDLSGNLLTGPIPDELKSCRKLSHVDLNDNSLSGPVPPWLGDLSQLGELRLSSNHFFGALPRQLFNSSKLLVLHLDGNSINGTLHGEIGDLSSLNILNLNGNQLSGPIPKTIGKLSNLYELQLSRNGFNGDIPTELGQLKNLQSILDLSCNDLTGNIPPFIGMLSKLEALDLSHNQLIGEVPPQIGDMSSLGKLNLSHNNLLGKLSKRLSHWPAEAFEGNLDLCGSPLDGCDNLGSGKQRSLSETSVVVVSAISTLAAIALLVLVVTIFLKQRREYFKRGNEVKCTYSSSSSSQARRRLLFHHGANKQDYKWEDIVHATKNLSDEFVIGSGGSGTVYKGEFRTGETVAVKKILWKEDLLLNRSFTREIRTLGRIRHRHLVKLMGYCINRVAGFNLLIYEYMENGSVWDWLHKQPVNIKKSLDWEARIRIAVGLAQGVEYLHHDCVPKIVHRDIKSSNVLLDSNMEAHLGDFGLAKSVVENYDSISDIESNSLFAGSYGYIAPEYAYTLKATEKTDVYSMGIVLMEIVSGKMPTDNFFGVDMDMVRWVEMRIQTQGSDRGELIDPTLKPLLPCEESAAYQVLEIALQCTRTVAQERPSARQASDLLINVLNNRKVVTDKVNMEPHK
ncbi:LRR receptor-like serine/threonine-protein kinase GSO1 [Hibiscus syriacus]|uniref:LRR receptor-like serine/threonine-protein kinase GSO1 n=1 Tax=Hibiscus syriacus TaxID=106335 RepID=UPI0019209B05|nr:LRR receptor-like serine/threonine-protein kinase GSO1 [Hibiscus syriacus]